LEDRKTDYLHGNVHFLFPIDAREQKFCPNKLKTRDIGQQKRIQNFNFFLNFFPIDYIFEYIEIIDSLQLDFS